jgi:hypothetical protein
MVLFLWSEQLAGGGRRFFNKDRVLPVLQRSCSAFLFGGEMERRGGVASLPAGRGGEGEWRRRVPSSLACGRWF